MTKQIAFIDPSLRNYPIIAATIQPGVDVPLKFLPTDMHASWSQRHSAPRQFGSMRGQVQVTDAFFESLPDEELKNIERTDDVLERHNIRTLSDRDRDIFLALLDSDAGPNDDLLNAFESHYLMMNPIREIQHGKHSGKT